MAVKKVSKPIGKKVEGASAKKVEPPKGPPLVVRQDPASDAKTYLMSIGTRPNRIAPMVAWAKGKGLVIATFSQWETLFKTF